MFKIKANKAWALPLSKSDFTLPALVYTLVKERLKEWLSTSAQNTSYCSSERLCWWRFMKVMLFWPGLRTNTQFTSSKFGEWIAFTPALCREQFYLCNRSIVAFGPTGRNQRKTEHKCKEQQQCDCQHPVITLAINTLFALSIPPTLFWFCLNKVISWLN